MLESNENYNPKAELPTYQYPTIDLLDDYISEYISIKSVLNSDIFQNLNFDLPIVIGKDSNDNIFSFDLTQTPHLLIAGASGQGKSTALHTIITSLLYKKHPTEIKFVVIDTQRVELSFYSKLEKHFLAKRSDCADTIITDDYNTIQTLKSLCVEMDSRLDLFMQAGVRNIKEYNEKFINRILSPSIGHRYMPYIVVVIDELSNIMLTSKNDIEEPIIRLAQSGRATGIHFIITTKHLSAKMLPNSIKVSIPSRISFKVGNTTDSQIIINTSKASKLTQPGDFLTTINGHLTKAKCAYITIDEINKITEYIFTQLGYSEAYKLPDYIDYNEYENTIKKVDLKKRDDMFEEAARLIVQYQQGSTSLLQLKLELGYNRTGRIMDQLEAAGIVGPSEGSKARQVYISDFNELDAILERLREI